MRGIRYNKRFLKKSDDTEIFELAEAGNSFESEIIEFKGDSLWGIQITPNFGAGSGTFTIEHSVDGVNFVAYSDDTIDIDLSSKQNRIKVDNHCVAPFLRFAFDFSGASEGGDVTIHFFTKEIL